VWSSYRKNNTELASAFAPAALQFSTTLVQIALSPILTTSSFSVLLSDPSGTVQINSLFGAQLFFSYPGVEGFNVGGLPLTSVSSVPGPIVGAGLPGLMLAALGLLGWRRRQRIQ
jgi:LPXTG-motif cell wall-anchored protein